MYRYRFPRLALYASVCFGAGFPKEDLFGHLQDGSGRDYEERASEEHGRWKRGRRCGRGARGGGLRHREALHAAAALPAE